ncbi:30S ribosomal protein S3 [Candidatus Marsarchaeota archaeon]|nr:30S ribosomal protein S3 [Candidatus Marsarchaeota archaeon]MCL5404849.1 30S ribosomal protein S3 [Candidatus Marsarchaeota archaeon]
MGIEMKFIDDSIIKMNISKYLSSELSRAGFSRVEIQKTPVLTRITVYVLNPGRVIGRVGKNINELTETIKNKFSINNPQISVVEIQNKMLEPLLVAKDITFKLERSINPRKIIQFTLKSIMENGALGAEIIISGKLAAKGARAKVIRKSVGYIPKAGDITNLVLEGRATAYPKYGAIGVKVRIVPPGTVFPDREIKAIEIPKSILNS